MDDLITQLSKVVDDKVFSEQLAKEGKKDADMRFSEEQHYSKLLKIFEMG